MLISDTCFFMCDGCIFEDLSGQIILQKITVVWTLFCLYAICPKYTTATVFYPDIA